MSYNLSDTICAQSTPAGRGGIHVVRVSGNLALEISKVVFSGFHQIENMESHRVYYGFILDPKNDSQVDEVLVTYFKAGKSFSTEETVEISCHGNPVIVKKIIEIYCSKGCRLAERGEFSYRAFKGGRLNVDQAESLLSLIESNNEAGIAKSLKLLNGDVRKTLKFVEDELIWIVSRLEAKIDFSSEDIEIVSDKIIDQKISWIIDILRGSINKYASQTLIDKGIKTIILGPPNAGKSSLFNLLVDDDRSIVSEVEGTTRDYVSELAHINGKAFEMIDTAGLRITNEDIESQGISKVNDLISGADLILILVSACTLDLEFLKLITDNWRSKRVLFCLNKIDLLNCDKLSAILEEYDSYSFIPVSVYNRLGIEVLESKMSASFDTVEIENTIELVSLRQKENLSSALSELEQASAAHSKSLGDEFTLSHLNTCLKTILSLFHIDNDELIRDKIFKDFCLGK